MKNKFSSSLIVLLQMLLISLTSTACSLWNFSMGGDVPQRAMDLIANEIRNRQADPEIEFLLDLEEIPIDHPGLQSQLQVYRIDEGPYSGETYLIHGERAQAVGTAFGGHGLASMLVTDLDHNGSPELAFTYSFGSGIHQSRIGMYDPDNTNPATFESDIAFFGDIGLYQQGEEIQVRLIDPNPGTLATEFQDVIGILHLIEENGRPQLIFQQTEALPVEILEKIVRIPMDEFEQ
jgi:hypothetical protein